MYQNPDVYDALPYRHSYTLDGEEVLTGFFMPAFALVIDAIDNRGVCDHEKAKEILSIERAKVANSPKTFLIHCAEYCWTAEEAFNLEGENKFNKIKIAEQMAEINLHKRGKKVHHGWIDYIYKNSEHSFDNIADYKWIDDANGPVLILEYPVWSNLFKEDIQNQKNKAELEGIEFEEPAAYEKMDNLYVAGIDGIDLGMNDTSKSTKDPSDFCMVIMRRALGLKEPLIVATYKDRPNDIRQAYKTAMCLALFYNCLINIEATRVGLVTWAREHKLLSYFMKRPRATLTDIRYGSSKLYGTPATAAIINHHTDLTAAFVEDYYSSIWFIELLQLLISYNDENKTKFDYIAALGMCLLADEELSGRVPVITNQIQNSDFTGIGYYKDENGYTKYGRLPSKLNNQIKAPQTAEEYAQLEIGNGHQRFDEMSVQYGVRWRY